MLQSVEWLISLCWIAPHICSSILQLWTAEYTKSGSQSALRAMHWCHFDWLCTSWHIGLCNITPVMTINWRSWVFFSVSVSAICGCKRFCSRQHFKMQLYNWYCCVHLLYRGYGITVCREVHVLPKIKNARSKGDHFLLRFTSGRLLSFHFSF